MLQPEDRRAGVEVLRMSVGADANYLRVAKVRAYEDDLIIDVC